MACGREFPAVKTTTAARVERRPSGLCRLGEMYTDGVFYTNSFTNIAQITDGTSSRWRLARVFMGIFMARGPATRIRTWVGRPPGTKVVG